MAENLDKLQPHEPWAEAQRTAKYDFLAPAAIFLKSLSFVGE
jgi:hypothetical protein